jgi:hypothetical protein
MFIWFKKNLLVVTLSLVAFMVILLVLIVQIFGSEGNKPSDVLGLTKDSSSQNSFSNNSSEKLCSDNSCGSSSTSLVSTSASSLYSATTQPKQVITIANGDSASGLNTRIDPCGKIINPIIPWGTVGEIIEESADKECNGKSYKWYKIKWSTGVIGWSISDYLKIDLKPFESKDGFIEGGITYPAGSIPAGINYCAVKTSAPVYTYCTTTTIKDTKFINSTGYRLHVTEGTYKVYAKNDNISKDTKAYYDGYIKCIGEKYSTSEDSSVCDQNQTTPILISVSKGSTSSNITLGDWYNMNP